MSKINCNSNLIFAIVILISGFIASCSSVPAGKTTILKEAREAYAQAQAHPKTTNLAELSKAKQALEKAERAKTAKDMQHLAYVAKQKAKIALTVAKRQSLTTQKIEYRRLQNPQLQKQFAAWYRHKIGRLKVILDNGYATSPQTNADIETVAAFLKQHPQLNVSVEGHTDNNGTHQYNLGLAERNATSIKFALMERGIASKRVQVKSFGETRPITSNSTETGRKRNRRVELFIQ